MVDTIEKDNLISILVDALSSIDEGVFFVDERGILVFCNQTAARLCGENGRFATGTPFFAHCRPIMAQQLHPLFRELLENPDRALSAFGTAYGVCYEINCHALLDEAGGFIGMTVVIRDVTERRRYSKILRHIASVDSLTRLNNRRHFYMKLREEARRAVRQGYPLSLIVLDLDNFKNINDTLGHIRGDEAMRDVAKTITDNVRVDVDIPCRYGGDEFAIILPNADLEQAAAIARRIREELPLRLDPPVTVSGGVAEMGERDPESLVHIADRAMYRAKNLGGDLIFVEHENPVR